MSQGWGRPATQRPGLPASHLSQSDMPRCDNTASNHNMSMKALKRLQLLDMFDCHTATKTSATNSTCERRDSETANVKKRLERDRWVGSECKNSIWNYEATSMHQDCNRKYVDVFNLHLKSKSASNSDRQSHRLLKYTCILTSYI